MLRDLATPRRVDAFVAAGLFGWAAPTVPWWWRPPGHVPATPVVLGYLALALASSVPFLWWRRFPGTVLAFAAVVLAVKGTLDQDGLAAFAAFLVAAYGLGAHATEARRWARGLGWASLAAAAMIGVGWNLHRLAGVPFALAGAAFLLGDAATARRAEAATAVEAAHLAERARIARELHDVLAHQLSAIAVQAGAARLTGVVPPHLPATVERLSREALTELNHLLGVLRKDGHDAADAPSRRPAPSLTQVEALLATAREAGVRADLAVTRPVRDVSPGLQLSAYRIIQESLTNVARHAPGARALVTLRYLDDHLAVEVVNGSPAQGRRSRPCTGGRGLLGMRERAASYGGAFEAAPSGDGFRVAATLPYDARTDGT